MGKFKKPSRDLNKFVKKNGSSLSKRKLAKINLGITSGVVVFNLLVTSSSFAQHINIPALEIAPFDHMVLTGQDLGDGCFRILPVHKSSSHSQTGHTSMNL